MKREEEHTFWKIFGQFCSRPNGGQFLSIKQLT